VLLCKLLACYNPAHQSTISYEQVKHWCQRCITWIWSNSSSLCGICLLIWGITWHSL